MHQHAIEIVALQPFASPLGSVSVRMRTFTINILIVILIIILINNYLANKMPNPYSSDLRWRIVYLHIGPRKMKVATIANFLEISPSTVKRYINKFYRTGDVTHVSCERKRNGPTQLLGDFEQAVLLRMISNHPGIYLHEIQSKLLNKLGVIVSLATICRSLRYLGCTRQYMHHIALQQSEVLRSKFMAEISLYDPSMLIWIDESGCDR